MQLNDFYDQVKDKLNTKLLEPFNQDDELNGLLHESMRYSITNGGKRMRPLFVLASLQAFGMDYALGLSSSQAVEYIHTYSLIHDDLPAMDDDDYRRGELSNHRQFDEGTAILAGDALLTYAFEAIASDEVISDTAIKLKLVKQLANAAGHQGMVAGQMGDIQAEGKTIGLQKLKTIHTAKTGALVRFSIGAAALITNISEETAEQLENFADHYGIAYQIHNDLQEIVWSDEERGKKSASDSDHDKNTYPAILGNQGAMAALESEIASCQAAVKTIKENHPAFDDELILDFLTFLKL